MPVQNFQTLQYLTKKYVLKIFGEVINIKPQAGFKLMTYRLVVDPLTHCAMLLGDNVEKETTCIVTPCFIVYFDKQ